MNIETDEPVSTDTFKFFIKLPQLILRKLINLPFQLATLESQSGWAVLYLLSSLAITILNKLVLNTINFNFPWMLTGGHALLTCLGTWGLARAGVFQVSNSISWPQDYIVLFVFSILYTVNIAVSNLSMGLVSLPFHQIVRSMGPMTVVVLEYIFMHRVHSRKIYIAIIPVCLGVALTALGEVRLTFWGGFITMFGAILASTKVIASNALTNGIAFKIGSGAAGGDQEGLLQPGLQIRPIKLHPLDLLLRMSFMAFPQCLFMSFATGEAWGVRDYLLHSGYKPYSWMQFATLQALNAFSAFAINWVSFSASKHLGPLSQSVLGNLKQVITIVVSVMIFSFVVNWINGVGAIMTILGCWWFVRARLEESS
jgi:drug/metabolite transporter (DMT)-like permease